MRAPRPFVTWRGGAGIGPLMVRWPFASLRASRDRLEVTAPGRHYTLTPEQVRSIKRAGLFPALGMGVEIAHDIPGCPPLKFFPVFARSIKLLDCLKTLGYKTA